MFAQPPSDLHTPPNSIPSTPIPSVDRYPRVEDENVYDLIGVGLGPTHLALAIAHKESSKPDQKCLFMEVKDKFSWHSPLLLPASRMQISFLKDLATFRNPASSYTFVNYLHSHGVDRLAGFSNIGCWTPSRTEWAAYLTWAAARLTDVCEYSTRVLNVEAVKKGEKVEKLKVTSVHWPTETVHVRYTRNISIGVGAIPKIPEVFSTAQKSNMTVSHTCQYLPTLNYMFGHHEENVEFKGRFAVIGGGQSSAEVYNDLINRYPNAQVDLVYRASALVPADDSPFVNARAFDPASTEEFNKLTHQARKERLEEFKRANYSCVAPELLEGLYTLLYKQRVKADIAKDAGLPVPPNQYNIMANSKIVGVKASEKSTSLDIQSTLDFEGQESPAPVTKEYDAIFLGTGYERPPTQLEFLRDVAPYLPKLKNALSVAQLEPSAKVPPLVEREYYIAPESQELFKPRIFCLGQNEQSHGLSDSLLSVGAVRAGEVVSALSRA